MEKETTLNAKSKKRPNGLAKEDKRAVLVSGHIEIAL
jgi:hypothetical protein